VRISPPAPTAEADCRRSMLTSPRMKRLAIYRTIHRTIHCLCRPALPRIRLP
jgi:hypothetical protein